MPTDNKLLLAVGLDQAALDKTIASIGKQLNSGITKSLKSLDLNAALKIKPIALTFNVTQTLKDFQRVKDSLKVKAPLTLDLKDAKQQIKDFQNGLAPLKLGVALTKPAVTPVTNFNLGAVSLNESNLDDTSLKVDKLKNSLRNLGIAESDIQGETGKFEAKIRSIRNVLDDIANKQAAYQKVTGTPYTLTDADILRLAKAEEQYKKLDHSVDNFNKTAAKSSSVVRDNARFFQSFAFQVGLLGFSFLAIGRRLQQASQQMFQLIDVMAQATEPIQRVKNLLTQDEPDASKRSFISDELQRLADIPGANLESVADGFRKLNSIGLETADTLKLLEGLIKTTGRSGVGAQGVALLAQQFRQFASSGQFRQQDIKAISEQGGKDISDIINKAYGSLDPKAIAAGGPDRFFATMIAGLEKVPAPLATLTDKLNIIKNSLIRIADSLSIILIPGLEKTASLLKNDIEPIFRKIDEYFKSLSPNAQNFFGGLLSSIPAVLGGLGILLSILGTLAVGIASVLKISEGWTAALGLIARTTGIAVEEISLGAVALEGISSAAVGAVGVLSKLGAGISYIIQEIGLIIISGGGVVEIIKDLVSAGIVGGLSSVGEGFLSIVGAIKLFSGATGIGLVITLILSLITNAGHARDVVMSALGNVYDAFRRLFTSLYELAQGSLGKALILLLSTLGDLLGGVLADALATAINALANIVNLLNDALNIISNPSWAGFGNILNGLYKITIGWATDLGKLLAASFIDAIGSALIEVGIFTGIGKRLQDQAEALRFSLNPVATGTAEIKDNVVKTGDAVVSLNSDFRETNKLISDISKVTDELANKFAKIRTDLSLNQIKFTTSEAISSAQTEFEKLIKSDPRAAQAQVEQFGLQQQAQGLIAIRAESATEIKTIANDLTRAFNNLNSLPTDGILKLLDVNKLSDLREALRSVVTVAQTGSTALSDYSQKVELIQSTTDALVQQLAGQNVSADVSAGLTNLKAALTDVQSVAERLATTIGKRSSAEQDSMQQRIKLIRQYKREIELAILQLGALDKIAPLKKDLEDLNTQFSTLQDQYDSAIGRQDLAGAEVINARILALKEKIADKELEIAKAGILEKNLIEQRKLELDRELKTLQNKNQTTLEYRNLLKKISEEQEQAFQSSLDNVSQFVSKIKELQTVSPEVLGLLTMVGISPGGPNGEFLPDAQVNAIKQEALKEALRNYATRVGGLAKQAAQSPVNTVNNIEDLSTLVGATSGTPSDILKNSSLFTEVARRVATEILYDTELIQNALDGNAKAITKIEKEISASGISDNEKARLEATRDGLLQTRKQLTAQGQAVSDAQAILNKTIETRGNILDQELINQQKSLNLEIQKLNIRQQLLDLQSKYQQLLSTNRAANNEPLIGTGVDLIAKNAADQAEGYRIQREAIKVNTDLQVKELEVKKLAVALEMRKAGYTEDQIKATQDLIDKQIELVKKIGDQSITGVNSDEQANKLGKISGAIQVLTDHYNNLYSAARQARQSMMDFFNNLTSGEYVLDAFQKLLDGTGSKMQFFSELLNFAVGSALKAFGNTLISVLEGGGAKFSEFLGTMLMQLGEALIQMSLAAVAAAFIHGVLHGGFFAGLAEAAATVPGAAIGVATGAGLIIAGQLLGGKGTYSPSGTASTNASNSANTATGASGQATYDPTKDPKTMYQKALMARILIDIRHDDGIIVKKVIKAVNDNGRLANLIGNNRLGFGY